MMNRHNNGQLIFWNLSKMVLLVITLMAGTLPLEAEAQTNLSAKATVANMGLQVSTSELSSQKITLQYEQVSIAKLLKYLEQKEDIRFSYNQELLAGDPKVTVRLTDATLRQALDDIFKYTSIDYHAISGGYIVLRERKIPRIQETITGTITDAQSGETLPGVNILVKGTSTGASTDADGQYELEVESLQDTLVVSFVGYKTQQVSINGRTTINIEMQSQAISGEEMVVVGYGTQEAENLTSSVSTVSADELKKGYAIETAQLLKGKVPGLSISKTGSNPADNSTLQLRGVGTLKGSDSPLVIVDGIEGSLSEVSPQDVESVSVLKGASASAIYGTRGSSGVVIVTTKSANKKGVMLKVDSYVSTQKITKELPVYSASEYRQLAKQNIKGVTDYGASTDWSDLVLRDVPFSSVNNITLSAGDGQTSYIANLNYQRLEGIMKRSDNNELRGRFQINHSMFDGKLDLQGNILLTKEWRYKGSESGSFSGDILRNVSKFNPTRPIKNEDGSYNENASNHVHNPVSILRETNGSYQQQRGKLFGHAEYTPVKNLALKVQGSRLSVDGIEGYSETKNNVFSIRDGLNGYASRRTNKSVVTILNTTAEYRNTYKSNNYTVLAGYTWKEHVSENFYASNYDFPTDKVQYNNLSIGNALAEGNASLDSYKQKSNLLGYFARLNYNYKHKYLLTASFRREASSKFGENNKWGTFPAVSAGWNISNEAFMDPFEFVNNFKIRFGYGVTGSEPTAPYQSLSRLGFSNKFLYQGQWQPTAQPVINPNPNLKWEEKKEYELGLDFGVLNNRMSGTFDVFNRRTEGLLYSFTVPTPPYLFDSILANTGTLENKGLEIHLNGIPIQRKDIQWQTTVNYSMSNSTLSSLSGQRYSLGREYFDTGSAGNPINENTYRVEVGQQIGNYYGYKSVGVTDDGYWMVEGSDGTTKSINDAQPDDKQYIGNGNPDFNLSWSNTLQYKNWDLNILMEGRFGFQILNIRKMHSVPSRVRIGNVLKGTFDKLYGKRPLSIDQSQQYVSYFLEKGDYWKIDNITLGYSFNVKKTSVLRKARIYASADNLYTITGYSGYDPSYVNYGGLTPGTDPRFRYPPTRKFTLGISLSF